MASLVAGTTGWRLGAAGAAVVAVLAGFLLGRSTVAGAKPQPDLKAVSSSATAIALPQLSQAAPLPALRPKPAHPKAPAAAVTTAPTMITTVSVPVVKAPPPSKTKLHTKPIRIGGSG
jgi:hypothetical protein